MSIYTKNGDSGYSDVFGKRLKKSDRIFCLIGTVDKLNAVLNLAYVFCENEEVKKKIFELFQKNVRLNGKISGFCEFDCDTDYFEKEIDLYTEKIRELSLYDVCETKCGAFVNLARTVCRDAERIAAENGEENSDLIKYFNRMSDYLYALGKYTEF